MKYFNLTIALGNPAQTMFSDIYETSGLIFVGIVEIAGGYRPNGEIYYYEIPFYCDEYGLLPASEEVLAQFASSNYRNLRDLPKEKYGIFDKLVTLKGRIIDTYPNSNSLTIQTTEGQEEIVYMDTDIDLIKSLKIGLEVEIISIDIEGEIYVGSNIKLLPSGILHFRNDLSEVKNRVELSPVILGKNLGTLAFYKTIPLVFIDSDGKILSEHFKTIKWGYYNLDLKNDISEHKIEFPFPLNGTWGIKVKTKTYGENETLQIIDIMDPPKNANELKGKIIYFKITPRNG